MVETTQPTIEPTAPVIPPTPQQSIWESLASFLGKFINDETHIGATGKAGLWSAAATLTVAILTAIIQNPQLFLALHWGVLIVAANIILVFLKSIFFDQTRSLI